MSEETKQEQEAAQLPEKDTGSGSQVLRQMIAATAGVFCAAICIMLLAVLFLSSGTKSGSAKSEVSNVTVMDKYDMYMTNQISNALDGVLAIKKTYWLSDSDQVAPEPNQEGYGEATDPAELQWLLDEAADLIDGQEMLFSTTTEVWSGDKIYYYYDETILVITWKQIIDGSIYTISEVKIAHPSQFRRFLAGGEFGSDKQYVTTEMASSVNAVVATSGDFYKFRRVGAIVYDGVLQRFEGNTVDTCFINDDGDLLFAYRGDLKTQEETEAFIEENNVRFSLAFGPVLVDNGEACAPSGYPIGEINEEYSRAAVCQKDELHYMFVNLTGEPAKGIRHRQTISEFAENLAELGCEKAYALDGGQTTVIAMDGELISNPDYGTQRQISDIIYFATALPDGE